MLPKGHYQVVVLNLFLSFAERSSVLLWLRVFQTSSRQIIEKRLFPEGNLRSLRKILMNYFSMASEEQEEYLPLLTK